MDQMMYFKDNKLHTRFFFLAAVAAITLPLLAACARSAPQIIVEPASQDLGEQPQQLVELTYTVRNTGDAPLKIEKISTSCDCTEAKLDRAEIPAGETAQLTVTLDPVEDNLFGDVNRVIYLRSNDPDEPEVSVEFSVQIQKP